MIETGQLQHTLDAALVHDVAAVAAAARPQVDHMVGHAQHLQVVLDDHHRVAAGEQRLKDIDQLAHVVEMQPDRRVVQDVNGGAAQAAGQLLGQLDALRLAAREDLRALAQAQVAQADIDQDADLAGQGGDIGEQFAGFAGGQVQDIAMERPLNLTWRVSELKRSPSQTGQVISSCGRKLICSFCTPRPSQASQRPPRTL